MGFAMTTSLENALVKAREKLLSSVLNEAQVSQGPVRSILQALGWDTFDVDIVVPEYSVGNRRVDYALKASPSTTDIFLEIKAPGRADDAADQQLFEYAFHVGVPFAVLTDGRVWNFYLPSGQGHYQDRRLFKLDIVERELSEACERLERYLSFDRVKSGKARLEASREYEDRFQRNKVKELIPKVWQGLLTEPDDLLCDLLIEAVEAQGGQRPLREDAMLFLRALATDTPVARATPENGAPFRFARPPSPMTGATKEESLRPTKNVGFRIGDHEWQPYSSGKQCYIGLIRQLVANYPEFPVRFQSAKVRGKRAWISRSKEELFPGQPKFQQSEVTAVGGGWLLGTNLSAQVDMPTRVEAACACIGLVFGRDVKATFI